MAASLGSAAPLNVNSNTDLPEDTTTTYDSISVSNGAVLTIGGGSGITVTGAVTVTGNSSIVFAGKNVDAQVGGEWVGEGSSLTAASVTVDAGSAIHADGQGYLTGLGPGGPGAALHTVGASHAGLATASNPTQVKPVYGSMTEPVDLGSAGGAYFASTAGGGAIKLTVSGTLMVNGVVSADGTSSGPTHSGAAGGSIWITTGTLAGAGSIHANAGVKTQQVFTHDSSGGRVAIIYGDASGFNDLGAIQAEGVGSAGDGTVYLRDSSTANGSLTVHGRVRIEPNESVTHTAITVEDGGILELGGGSALTVAGTLRVKGGGVVLAEGKNRDAQVNGAWAGAGVSISAVTLTVDLNGRLHADGQGYLTGLGPGGPGAALHTVGASHAGLATASNPTQVKPVYGSMTEPVDLGSAGGAYFASTAGGGAIKLTVSGTLTVNGVISADGTSSGPTHSGAAGGSIWITTGTLAGAGSIHANAGVKTQQVFTHDSSGGRVAVIYGDASGFDDLGVIQAKGQGQAQDGTIFLARDGAGGRHLTVLQRMVIESGVSLAIQSMDVASGRVEMGPGAVLSVAQTLALTGTARLFVEWNGIGGRIEASNLSVSENAAISADGLGYGPGENPSGPAADETSVGAGHGGDGGGVGNNKEYGDPLEPTTAGSAGGVYFSSIRGGGVIRIVVSNELSLNGRISANGTGSGTSHSGAAGGSIWVDTGTLTGTGSFHADAKRKGTGSGNNNSSGGRIAVYYDDADDFEGFVLSSAASGGPGAEDGTVVFVDKTVPDLGLTVFDRLAFPEMSVEAFGRLTVDLNGRLELGGGSILVVADHLELAGNAVLEAQSINALNQVLGGYAGRGVSVLATDLTIGAGSRMTADGFGYPTGTGPGGAASNSVGGSHGGAGGGASGPVYGNAEQPIDLGSSGGAYFSQVRAGGAIGLTVPGALVIDGVISANGVVVSGANHSGAAGGSVWIRAGTLSGDGKVEANASAKGLASTNTGSGGGRVAVGTTGTMSLNLDNIEAKPTDSSAQAGTIRIQELDDLDVISWASDLPPIVFGAVDVSWVVLRTGAPFTSTLRLIEGGTETILLSSSSILPRYSWDSLTVPDGDYTLAVTVKDEADNVIGELRADVFVANEYVWHTGTIEADETWPADRLNVVRGNLVILGGATVTIEPGTVIKVTPGSQIDLLSGASIDGAATEDLPIVFTSFLDDAIAGDSNRDGIRTVPGAGDWRGVKVAVGGQLNINSWVSILYAIEFPDSTINGIVRWTAGTLQWIREDVTVTTGSTLIIEPGAVVKFGRLNGIILSPGATLQAEGTIAQPIVLTSERDDFHGGDTNEDGNTTEPAAGDWRWIFIDGSKATFSHVEILYGGGSVGSWSGTGVIRTTGASEVLIENSLISDSFYDGVLAWGGPVTIRNSVFRNIDRAVAAHPGSAVTVRNSTFDRNRIGILIHGGSLDVANTIIANSFTAGLLRDLESKTIAVSHTLFFNPRAGLGNIAGTPDVIGINGNIVGDPRFLNSLGGEYRLHSDSPAIDAADTAEAPELDRNGAPRFNEPSVPDTGVPGTGGVIADIGAYEFAEGAASEIDLVVTQVSGPAEASVGGSAVISWTVRNDGTVTVAGPWTDEIWLVANPGTGSEILRESRTVLVGSNLQLAPGESAVFSEEIPVAASTAGLHRWKVRTNALGSLFEGANRSNNDAVSAGTTRIDVPAIAIGGEPQLVVLRETGDRFLFLLDTRKEGSILKATANGDGLAITELFWAFDRLPTPTDYDGRNQEFGRDDVTAFTPQGGLAYVLVRAAGLSEPDINLSLLAETVEFRISGVLPTQIGESGTATLEVGGAQLDDRLDYSLVSVATGQVYLGADVYSTAPNLAYPTFPLDGIPRGAYRVRAARGLVSVDSTQTVTVGQTQPADLDVKLIGDTQVRAGRKGGASILYRNAGNVDLVAPLMQLNAAVRVEPPIPVFAFAASRRDTQSRHPVAADEPIFIDNFLGTSSDGPAGILRPGSQLETHVLSFEAPTDKNQLTIDLFWQTADFVDDPFRWDTFKDALRPPDLPVEGWNRVFDLLKAEAGETYGEVNATAARSATQLSRVGDRERGFTFLLMQTLRLVDPSGWHMNKGRGGAFGEILPDITENRVYAVDNGRVAVRMWGYPRYFQMTLDETVYLPSTNDGSVLRFLGDHFELLEFDQARAVFHSDGNLDHVLDAYGNRVNFVYQSGRLAKLTRGDVDLIQFAYDDDGKVTEVTDRRVGTTVLGYDSKGRLVSIATPVGLAGSIDYFEDGLLADQPKVYETNAGSRIEVDYDELGRLKTVSQGAGSVAFDYPRVGEIRSSGGNGSRMATLGGAFGEVKRIEFNDEVLANLNQNEVTGLSRREYLGGYSTTRRYDEDAKLSQTIDPLGNSIFLSVNEHRDIDSVTDTLGRKTAYSYDDEGTRTGVVDALSGSASVSLNDAGRISAFIDRAGRFFSYLYDAEGRLTEKTLPGGSKVLYRYDSAGRMVEAENGAGKTTITYLSSGAIDRVTYPNGHWIRYTYDAFGRISEVEDDSGHAVGYHYGVNAVLAAVVDENGDPLVEYAIDAYGRQTSWSRANGTRTAFAHETNGTLVSVAHKNASDDSIAVVNYETDSLGRRTRADFGDHLFDYRYDGYGQLIEYDLDSETTGFYYDAAGNRVSVVRPGRTDDYAVNALNQYLKARDRVLEYDALGNVTLIKKGTDEWTFEYDQLDQLIRVAGPGEEVTYEYDAFGYRMAETVNGVRSELVPNPLMNDSLFAAHQGSQVTKYAYSPLGYVGFEQPDGKLYFYHFDGNGNTIAVSGEDGAIANRYAYLPYGEVLSSVEAVPNRFIFAGQQGVERAPGGNYWIRVRTYDPVLGRFLSPDTDASEGENVYTYGSNQPSSRVDFSGLDDVAGDGLSTTSTVVGGTNLVTGPLGNSVLNNLSNSNQIAQTEAFLAEIGLEIANESNANWAKKVDKLYDLGFEEAGKALEGQGFKDVSKLEHAFEKSTQYADETARALNKGESLLSWTKGLQKLGTGLTVGTAGYNTYKYRNGDPSVTGWDLLHDYTLVLTDGLGYNPHPVAQGISWGASAVDLGSQLTFTPIANWWYKPEDPFGPGMRPLGGRKSLNSRVVSSFDPNDKSATGVGEGGYIDGQGPVEYRIRFENVATASAAAQQVRVSDFLDVNLDWSTLELLEFGFNGTVVVPQQGASGYSGVAFVESDPNPVQCEIHLDPATGELTVDFRSFDADTLDWPEDPFAGFLPPNDETGRGEGYLRFSIWPMPGLDDGVVIENQASIVFDENEPIITNVAVNTIDTTAPTASVAALGERSAPSFNVSWSGDDAGGSGVERYDVYVSVDGGEWTLWLDGTAETSADYEGVPGSTYAFYVHATDALGFAGPVVPTAQAQTIAGVSFLVNISNRGGVGTGPNIMIPGFVIDGSGTKKVLVRAVGPTLGGFGVQGTLEDPQLTVVSGGADIAVNDNWSDATEAVQIAEVAARVGAFPLEAESADAAALLDLEAGSYTVKVSGVALGTGVALVELYDTDEAANPSSKLVNISNRGEVGVGSAIMIPGFVVGGQTPKTVLIRGVGPKLGDFGVQGVLEDPTLGVFRSGEADALHTNDNWGDAANATELAAATASVGAFALEAVSKDAAVLVTLEPGAYTVKVSGVDGTEGVALVEIYEVEE